MIRHIVVFRFPPETDAGMTFEKLAGVLRPLQTVVPRVRSLRVDADPHRVDWHWDAVLVSEHESWADLEAYQVHPAHVAALDTVNALVAEKVVVDHEL
jgi:hypothetical protein